MRVRDLPRELLLKYTGTILEVGLPPEWIDLDFIPFLFWIDAARKGQAGTIARWNQVRQLHHELCILLLPIIEKCPALSVEEAMEMLPESERARCLAGLRQLALM